MEFHCKIYLPIANPLDLGMVLHIILEIVRLVGNYGEASEHTKNAMENLA